jgi:tetratricopeptide (TPR) repeat protein
MSTRSSDVRLLAALLLVAQVLLLVLSVLDGSWRDAGAPFPFAWRDVAVVHVACAVPLAVLLAMHVRRKAPPVVALALAALALAAAAALMLGALRQNVMGALLSSSLVGLFLRAGLALCLTFAGVLPLLFFFRNDAAHEDKRENRMALGGLALLALLLAPWIFVSARCRHDAARLAELVDQSRFGEGRTLAYGLVLLDPQRDWRGRPLRQTALQLDRKVTELETATRAPLPPWATAAQRLDRARDLAMLGRTETALDLLAALRDPELGPEKEMLRGAIHEAREEWSSALQAYQNARNAWEPRPESSERTKGMLTAATGIGYSSRKLGRYAEAEVAFLERLNLDADAKASAESHFLLARYYEDTEQTQKAQMHARRAMELDPARYDKEGADLIRKLSVFHFGCLWVEREGLAGRR